MWTLPSRESALSLTIHSVRADCSRRIVRRGSGPLSRVRSIAVRDANGDQLTVYEFRDRRFLRKVRRMKLCTGEMVELDGNGFVIIGTGERLTPVDC